MTIGALVLLAIRKYDVIFNPQLWAEDGGLFLVEADARNWSTLFKPYAGYLHFVPRLVALCGSYLPMLRIPTFYTICCFVVTGIVVWYVQSPRIPLPAKIVAALAIVAIPHTGEVYLAICNLQWITAIALFALCIARNPHSRSQRIGDAAVIAAFGLTGPFIVLALPLLALRLWQERTHWNGFALLLAIAIMAIQAPSILHRDSGDPLPPIDWLHLLAFCGRRTLLQPFVGAKQIAPLPALLLSATFLVFLGVGIWRTRLLLPKLYLLITAALLVVAAITVKARPDTWVYSDYANGDRYFFIPKIFLLWSLAILVTTLRGRAFNFGVFVLLAPPVIYFRSFIFPPAPPQHWADYARRIESGNRTVVPILPDGFSLTHPGRQQRH